MNTPSPDLFSWRRAVSTRLAAILLAALAVMTAATARAQVSGTSSIIATDAASNYSSYGSTASSPANGGIGWGAWNFTGNSTTNTAFCGEFLGAPPNTGLIGAGNAWGLYSNTSNTASVYRGFGFDIIGDTISVDLENTSTIGGTIGWSLWNASQTNMTEFFFSSGNSNWTVPAAAGNSNSVLYTTSAIQTDLTITSATTFSLTATINGGATVTTTGAFTGSTNATGISDLFRFFSFNDGSNNNIYFNNEKVFIPTFTGTGNFGTSGNWASNGQLSVTPINGANIAFGGTVGVTATNNSMTTVNSYIFNSGAGAYTLSGSSVTLGSAGSDNAGITNNSSNLQTVAEGLTIGTGAVGTAIGATINSASNAIAISGSVNLNSSRLLVTGTANTTLSGIVSGASNILKQGSGTLVLNNASNSFGPNISGTGNLFIDAGTVSVGATGALGSSNGTTTGYANIGSSVSTQSTNATALLISTGGVTVANPVDVRYVSGNTYGTQQLGGSNTSGTATYSGPVALHNSVTISATSGGTVAIAGAIAPGVTTGVFSAESVNGTPGITVIGNGVVRLTASNSYLGATTLNGGTLVVAGSINGSATTVNNGATLAGTGTTGSVTVAATGGTIAPGDGSTEGTLNTGAIDTHLGGTSAALSFALGGANIGTTQDGFPVIASDRISLSGTANITSADLLASLAPGYTAAIGDTLFLVIANSNAVTGQFGAFEGTAGTLGQGGTFNIGPDLFQISYDANYSAVGGPAMSGGDDIAVRVMNIPEPGTYGLALAAAGMLIAGRRIRRRQSR